MGTLIFNWRGLFATIVIGFPAFWALNQLENAGWTAAPSLCFIAIAMTLPLSMFAYTIDRCDRPGALRPYWDNSIQECYAMYGYRDEDAFNPDRRTAWCVWPLALGPYIIFLIYVGVWLYWAITGDPLTLLPYLGCSFASCVVAAIYAKTTEWVRVVPGLEILDDDDRPAVAGHSPHDTIEQL